MPSRLRALILLAVVLDLHRLGRAVRRLTGTPRLETIEVAGTPVEIVRPAGSGPWPAWIFVNGAHPERRREPVVSRLSEGLARAGFVVFVPDLPGLGEGTITRRTLEASCHVAEAAVDHPDVRNGRAALIGASTGAGLALVTAGQASLRERISEVVAVAPFADLERMICLATTRSYAEDGRFVEFEVTPLHRRVVARSLAATIPDDRDRVRVLDAVAASEHDEEADPFDSLPEDVQTAEAQAVLDLLRNDDPERFAEAFARLEPAARDALAVLSPVAACADVRAPVEIVVPPADVYFPVGEAMALAAALPRARLTVTATLDHTRPQASFAHARSLLRFDRFVVRGLRTAARS
jgi:pimeloyl-ACP methyl ester carboxylesterase